MKKKNKKSKFLLSPKKVNASTERWLCTLSAKFGDLFTTEIAGELKRIFKYTLDAVDALKQLDVDTVNNLSILMGVSEDKQTFQPILEVSFKKEAGNEKAKKSKHYLLSLIPPIESNSFFSFRQGLMKSGEINPAIANLFILHWQSLTSSALVNAFEGLVADKVESKSDERIAQIIYSHQKLQRVRKYVYTNDESKAILKNLADFDTPSFDLFLGSGLVVPEFHPFSFRPIINIKENSTTKLLNEDGSGNDYDTSRPCPPICNG